MDLRIGNGFDVHRFAEPAEAGAVVRLGGVDIPHTHRLLAHSDGDVAIHALCDALLGALSLGDIGLHFPDSDPAYKGIHSLKLLGHVMHLVRERGWGLVNADLCIMAEAPKIAPHRDAMRERLAQALRVEASRVGLKATTTEGLGFTGRREGIAALAVVLLGR